ncbi:MAG: GNAT family N-acetyltransferase [Candidatus Eisenbacteria bacterium]|nr:GNAT family N-acetyltransferase [Candidatus Eisenbacteria bacterium]
MSCLIRPPRTEDAPAISLLAHQLGYPQPAGAIAARLAGIDRLPGQAVFVAEDAAGRVIGWTQVCAMRHLLTDPYAEIVALVVEETARGRGTGRRLLARATAWAADEGFDILRLHTNIVRERAHRLYERLGFAREKTQYVYRSGVTAHPAWEPRDGSDDSLA